MDGKYFALLFPFLFLTQGGHAPKYTYIRVNSVGSGIIIKLCCHCERSEAIPLGWLGTVPGEIASLRSQ